MNSIPVFNICTTDPKFFMPHFPIFRGNTESIGNKNVKKILEELGNPHHKLRNIIHVVGTNGKGSTCAFLKSILMQHGFSVNTYTSPHLYSCNERINLNGKQISNEDLFYYTEKIKHICVQHNIDITIFESLTIIAFLAFCQTAADYTILEAGMGGLLDATNMFEEENVLGVILTSISYDHTKFLGETLSQIIKHKLGVAKFNKPIVLHPFNGEVLMTVLEEIAQTKSIPYFFGRDWNFGIIEFETGEKKIVFEKAQEEQLLLEMPNLQGEHQLYNLCAVIAFLYACNFNIDIQKINQGITEAKWAGRLEKITEEQFLQFLPPESEIWFDGAHNVGGAITIADWLKNMPTKENILIVSKTKGTEVNKFIEAFEGLISFGIALNSRGEIYPENLSVLKKGLEANNIPAFEANTFTEALTIVKEKTEGTAVRIIICGSLYLAREISFSYKDILCKN